MQSRVLAQVLYEIDGRVLGGMQFGGLVQVLFLCTLRAHLGQAAGRGVSGIIVMLIV